MFYYKIVNISGINIYYNFYIISYYKNQSSNIENDCCNVEKKINII